MSARLLTTDDIPAIARALADELHSRATSARGIVASGQGDPCDDEKEFEPMDLTSTADGFASSSLQEAARIGRRHTRALLREQRQRQRSTPARTSSKARR